MPIEDHFGYSNERQVLERVFRRAPPQRALHISLRLGARVHGITEHCKFFAANGSSVTQFKAYVGAYDRFLVDSIAAAFPNVKNLEMYGTRTEGLVRTYFPVLYSLFSGPHFAPVRRSRVRQLTLDLIQTDFAMEIRGHSYPGWNLTNVQMEFITTPALMAGTYARSVLVECLQVGHP